ncbi:MAG: magnesium transporter [Dehalococcoidia bacterium]
MVDEQLREDLRDEVTDLIENDQLKRAVVTLIAQHPADQADTLERMEPEIRTQILAFYDAENLAEVLEYLDEEVRADITRDLPAEVLAPLLDRVDEDIAADIVQDLPEDRQQAVVNLMEERESVEELLSYPEESAGGVMLPDVVALRRDWTVEESLQFLRREGPEVDQPFYLYVVDADGRLSGVVGLRALVTALPETPIAAIVDSEIYSVRVDEDREVAAERMRHYSLQALPVVDADGRLRGVITSDRVLDVTVEEATEDMFRMAGVGIKEWAFSPVLESAGRRIPWLGFNMAWAFAGAVIISLFEGTLDKLAALAIFMPMIAGQAGNAGIQTATIMVRSMALGEVELSDGLRVLRKEWILGLIKGALFGGVLGLVAWVWQGHALFGVVAGAAMFLNMLVASTTGVIIPLTLRRFGIDPATIAGVFDTMITDLMGFLIYLGLATIFITQLT